MAKNIKAADAKPGHNRFDPEKLKDFVARCETIQGEIDGITEAAKKTKAPHNEDMKAVKKEARKDLGITAKAFTAILTDRRSSAKMEAMYAGLDFDEQEVFDQMAHALGMLADTELGRAAIAKAKA